MARTFRQLAKWLVPSWLYVDDGEKVLYALDKVLDAATERLRQGLLARLPTYAGASALELIGRDRGIVRGRTETAEHYAARLVLWRDGHRRRGSAYALLDQFSEYWGGIDCWTIDVSGNRHDRTANGATSCSHGNTWDWDGAGATPNWARFWVVLDLTGIAGEQPALGDPELWGGAIGTPGYTIGQTGVTPDDVNALRRMMRGRAWKPAGTRAEWVIVSLDGTEPVPDGTWLNWSQNVGGVQTPTRSAAHRYWSLSPESNNVYAGDPDLFAVEYPLMGGAGTYQGNSSNFPAEITMPNGETYAGNPDNFPLTIPLVDDGDAPR